MPNAGKSLNAACLVAAAGFLGGSSFSAEPLSLSLDLENVQVREDRHRLLGTNMAMWHEPEDLFHSNIVRAIKFNNPSFLRIPGGSWSNEIYWNGNGVRTGDSFDHSKRVDGRWQVDYSGYAPGFRVHSLDGELSDYHGVVDVKQLHDKVQDMGARTVVTVNAGSGTPEMAAEWVRWANITNDYVVTYWEIGNELEGSWELGHLKSDGTPLTGKDYAEIFRKFATAMKAVDPDIQIGGPVASNLDGGYMEDLLKYAGDHVDFVSFHTYPVGKGFGDEAAFYQALSNLKPALQQYRKWIQTYQPARADEIGIALTEWNSKVFEDRDTGDLLNGLWTAAWMGEMLKGNLLFATQWDLLTRTETGGHGLMAQANGRWVPTGQYWATSLWSHHMGNDWIPSTLHGDADLIHLTATRDDRGIHLLVVNFNREETASLQLPTELAAWQGPVTSTTLSHATYFWDPFTHQPLWSTIPASETVQTGSELMVPAYSARVFSFTESQPLESGTPAPEGVARTGAGIFLPESGPADLPIEGWLFTSSPRAAGLQEIIIQGPAKADRSEVRIEEGAGRFYLTPTGVGTVTVSVGSLSTQVEIREVQARDEILWSFETGVDSWNLISDYPLSADPVERPNQGVARIDLENALPISGQDGLLATTSLPSDVTPERIGGVVADLKVAPGLNCPDGKTNLQVVLQSEADHWIPLGTIALKDLEGDWQTVRIPLPSPDLIPLMKGTYSLRLQLQQAKTEKQPVTGTLFVDNLGFLYR